MEEQLELVIEFMRAAQDFNAASSSTNFEIQKSQNEPKFNGVYSRNNLPKTKDEVYLINLDEYESIRTHWIVLYVNGDNITYLYSSGVEHMPKEIKKFIGNKMFGNINL